MNNIKLIILINTDMRQNCEGIRTEDYQDIIIKKFPINTRCEVQHKGVLKGELLKLGVKVAKKYTPINESVGPVLTISHGYQIKTEANEGRNWSICRK